MNQKIKIWNYELPWTGIEGYLDLNNTCNKIIEDGFTIDSITITKWDNNGTEARSAIILYSEPKPQKRTFINGL
jgi:hypothetical protein